MSTRHSTQLRGFGFGGGALGGAFGSSGNSSRQFGFEGANASGTFVGGNSTEVNPEDEQASGAYAPSTTNNQHHKVGGPL